MGTIVVIVAFLLAASANPIDDASLHTNGESSNTNGHDGSHSSFEELPKDDSEVSHADDTAPPDEENGFSGGEPQVSSGDESENQDEETASPNDTPSVSTGSDASNNSGNTVSTSVSTATPISTEDTANVTQPPDADPYDCQNRNPLKHIYDACTFLCGGDMMGTARDYSRCLLNYTGNFTEESEPTGLNENATGVCFQGTCIVKPNNATETTPQSPTVTTTTTTPTISESTPEPSMAETVANPETSGTGSPTTPNDSDVGIDTSSQSPPSQLYEGPVAME